MNRAPLTLTLLMVGLLGACAPTTRLTLLPEDGGKTSAVELKTSAGAVLLSRPYQTAQVSQGGELQRGETTVEAVREQHKLLLSLQPAAPVRFTLYFVEGGSRLTPESEAQLVQVLAQAGERPGGEILVTGHTDSVGSVEANDALSLKRAQSIRTLLLARGFKPELIEAMGRGERELRISTPDETEEPRNRRAEIVVR